MSASATPDRRPAPDTRPARQLGEGLAAVAGALRALPLEAIAVGLGLFALLAAFAAADPAQGMTASNSPFTDEAFYTVNARNFAQLGRWSTDEWNLHLVGPAFALLEGLWFSLVGPGIVQARLVTIACVSMTATALAWGLRPAVGRATAVFAGIAFAASGLILFYGRLTYIEDAVVLGLTLGTLVLTRDDRLTLRWGVVSGICYAVAIGAKPSAGFAAAGILAAVAAAEAWHDPAARRWVAGAAAAIVAAGLIWAIVIWLPNRSAVTMDLNIWASQSLSVAPRDALRSILRYLTVDNDHLYGVQLGPLVALGAAGFGVVVILRRRLGRAQARLAAVSIGWLACGFGILMIASYRPNRYALPLVPPLAILAALGLYLVGQWLRDWRRSTPDGRLRWTRRLAAPWAASWAAPALVVAATIVAAAPGLLWYGSWARDATYSLPDIQARFAAAVPDGERVAGHDVALYLMRSKAITLITQREADPANAGDLYVQGVRWYLQPVDDPPPIGVSDAVWGARQQVMCGEYGGLTECLYHLP